MQAPALQEMISKLRDVLVWEELPLPGLQQICRNSAFCRVFSRK